MEVLVQSLTHPYVIYVWHSGIGTGFSQSTSGLPLSVSFHQCPHLLIHLSPMLYNLRN